MKRRALLLGAAFAPALHAAEDALPAVLRRPAVITPLAPAATLLATVAAGKRIVAAGERGIVLLSDDGGRQWTQAKVPVQTSLTALGFADAGRGWAAGHLGVVLGTTDAGASWSLQLDGRRAAQAMLAAASDDAQRRHAEHLVTEGPDKPFFDVDAGGDRQLVVGAYGLAFESRDGTGWQPFAARLPNPKHLHLYAVRRVGTHVLIAGEQGLMLRSADGGASFEPIATPYRGSFFGLLPTKAGTLIAYGLRGTALRSADLGDSWSAIRTGVPVTLAAGIERDDGSLVLLAQNGDMLVSRDDGQTFERRPAPMPFPAAALAAADGGLVLAGLRGVKRLDAA